MEFIPGYSEPFGGGIQCPDCPLTTGDQKYIPSLTGYEHMTTPSDAHRHGSILLAVMGIIIIQAMVCTLTAAQEQTSETPVIKLSVPFGPIPVASREGINIAYELELSSPENFPLYPDKVDVLDLASGKVLYTINSSLLASLYHPGLHPSALEGRDAERHTQTPLTQDFYLVYREPGCRP